MPQPKTLKKLGIVALSFVGFVIQTFRYSIWYLGLLFVVMLVDHGLLHQAT